MGKRILFILVLFISEIAFAQCAMCKAVIENGNSTMGEGVNDGITYLMVFPYILVGTLFYFLYKHKKNSKN